MRQYSKNYSRLQKLEDRRNIQKAVLLSISTLALIIAMVVVGVPALIKVAVFVADVRSATRPIDKTDLIPPGPPQLYSAVEATNKPKLDLDGYGEQGASVYLTRNSESVGNTVVKDDSSFHFSDIDLVSGVNDFVAVAIDQSGNKSQPSNTLRVYFLNNNPTLDIDGPKDKQIITGKPATVEIKGKTDPLSRLMVNERVVIVSGSGQFSSVFSLNEGDNTFDITATDKAGNQTKKSLTVEYHQY